MRFRKVPVEIEAVRWEGDTEILDQLLGRNWDHAWEVDVHWDHDNDNDEDQICVWNSLERCWIPCPLGYWIVRGLKGEFYPCDPDVFEQSYDPIVE